MAGILNVLLGDNAAAGGSSVYDGIVATRGVWPQQRSGATNASSRAGYLARTDIAALSIICPNSSASESAPGATASITASVEYPPGVMTGQQIKFSGSATGTIPNGGMLRSDTLTLPQTIKNGDMFWIRTYRVCSSGLVSNNAVTGAYVDQYWMGDRIEVGTTDRTMSGDVDPTETNGSYHPIVIGATTAPSVLILGDSRMLGVSDEPDKNTQVDISGDRGEVARSIGPKFGYFNAGLPSESATTFIANHTQRLTLLPFCTHVVVGYATNDLSDGVSAIDSAATIEGHLTTIYGYMTGKTVFQTTVVPRTNSTDVWATTGGQSVIAGESARVTLNTDLRSTFHPAGGVFDIASVVETSLNSGIWKAPNKTLEGIHSAYSACLDIQASGVVNTSLIGTVTPPSDTGSGWGDHGTHVTVSSVRRTNDTARQTTTGGQTLVRGASGLSSGLKYFEVEVLGPNAFQVGLIDAATTLATDLDSYLGNTDHSFGVVNDGTVYNFGSGGPNFTTTQNPGFFPHDNYLDALAVWRFWVDFTNRFAYVARNTVFLNSGVPTSGVSGTGNVATWTTATTLYPSVAWLGATPPNPVRLRTNSFLYPLIGSYTAWG